MSGVIGIDPGITGAIALLGAMGGLISVADMPTITEQNGKNHVNVPELAATIRNYIRYAGGDMNTIRVKLERVQAMPGGGERKMGATSAFNFGRNFGSIIAVVQTIGLPLEFVTPQSWKKRANLIGAVKDYARTKAIELYPDAELHLKKHIGRADAILIARYG